MTMKNIVLFTFINPRFFVFCSLEDKLYYIEIVHTCEFICMYVCIRWYGTIKLEDSTI